MQAGVFAGPHGAHILVWIRVWIRVWIGALGGGALSLDIGSLGMTLGNSTPASGLHHQ